MGQERRPQVFVGVDGEGIGRNPHKYVMLCARDETGTRRAYIEDPNGLSTKACLNFFLGLPKTVSLFGFSLGYDWAKIFKDLPNEIIYTLFRPELRKPPKDAKNPMPRPVHWEGYRINMIGRKVTIARGRRHVVVWDVFAFYQSKFVTALKAWKVGDPERLKLIEEMKELRSEFETLSFEDIRGYCFEECMYLAQLVRKLVDAHTAAGFVLKNFHGAGSTASAILDLLEIKKKIRREPKRMHRAVASAFFGGRFEHSVIGVISGPVYGRDISSAYPYQIAFLPCLEHGKWSLTKSKKRMMRAKGALVHYQLPKAKKAPVSWGPFPYRIGVGLEKGSICFPRSSAGGWVYREEFLQGKKVFPHVRFREAWVLESKCDCAPFAKIPHYYRERNRIGKEGPGIVLKLGPNSVYGKLAQSVGNPPFQSWIWAGMITSGCRAQILELFSLHKNLKNVLAIATDGVYTRENVRNPRPLDTGTYGTIDKDKPEAGPKPLGGWESETYEKGIFFARPGIYWSNNPTKEQLKKVRARGIGKASLLKSHKRISRAWARGKRVISLPSLTRFIGAKTGVHFVPSTGAFVRSDVYGEWVERPMVLDLRPLPKRERITRVNTLTLRDMPRRESAPYDRSIVSQDTFELRMAQDEQDEQPDGGDLSEEWVG